jgi:hypothetical protein
VRIAPGVATALLLAVAGCAAGPASRPAESGRASGDAELDACALLTAEEVAVAQGEAVRDVRGARQAGGDLLRLSCFYTLPTFARSVSFELSVAEPGRGEPLAARRFWEAHFGEGAEREGEGEREGDEEREAGRPMAVAGLGDEAFWIGGGVSGALYVLQDDRFFRLSVGGGEAGASGVDRTRSLAERVLARLRTLR